MVGFIILGTSQPPTLLLSIIKLVRGRTDGCKGPDAQISNMRMNRMAWESDYAVCKAPFQWGCPIFDTTNSAQCYLRGIEVLRQYVTM